jgi:preprotein translocase subunit SecG
METIETIMLIVHTLIAVLIIALVLLQRGKGADAGAAFGSGASGTVFGARGSSSFFSRATAILATAFFASSLVLAYISSQEADMPDSLIENAPQQTTPAPAEDAGETGEPAQVPSEQAPPGDADAALPDLVPAQPADEPSQDEPPEEDKTPP